MALHDHFHPPLSVRRHWHAFHNAWATYLASDLNRQLPEGYFAEANVQFGIEIDVAAFDEEKLVCPHSLAEELTLIGLCPQTPFMLDCYRQSGLFEGDIQSKIFAQIPHFDDC